ncbi:Uncharacterised protein [Klebsiella michiganensis]|uniref:Uncharacterized protein n=1 Tax=Klebsiella michiganensis TaxID=1134687 RepID=A0A7H4PKI3_9ENTR|nr:Uncharacterised protein [Klebsiella michiganensis]
MDRLSPVTRICKVGFTMENELHFHPVLMSPKLNWMSIFFALMAGIAVKNLTIPSPDTKRWSAGFAAMT